jgi:hypothetical protein
LKAHGNGLHLKAHGAGVRKRKRGGIIPPALIPAALGILAGFANEGKKDVEN